VQGNIRYGCDAVLGFLTRHFNYVVLSTWDDEPTASIPKGRWDLVLNRKPTEPGLTHRNFQRLSSAAGLRRARELGSTHVLKWRTDMLPTQLDVGQLLHWAKADATHALESRLVTCAYRNLTVHQDWFSTIPDLFAFSDIELMTTLWGDESFNYQHRTNVPQAMAKEVGEAWSSRPDAAGLYCPEAELYALFKSRLQDRFGEALTHAQIARRYMRLVDHCRLGICWFGPNGTFRTITQALQHPWWTEAQWQSGGETVTEWGYPENTFRQKFRGKYLTRWQQNKELALQKGWYAAYVARR
jgi:hypothetical protein